MPDRRFSDALVLVQRDVRHGLGAGHALRLIEPGDDPRGELVHVALQDGRFAGEGLICDYFPRDGRGVLEAVAAAAQGTITEVLQVVWPTCPEHGLGLHASHPFMVSEGPRDYDSVEPVWWCPSSPHHLVAAIGDLG